MTCCFFPTAPTACTMDYTSNTSSSSCSGGGMTEKRFIDLEQLHVLHGSPHTATTLIEPATPWNGVLPYSHRTPRTMTR